MKSIEDYCRSEAFGLVSSIDEARKWLNIHKPSLGAYGEFLLLEIIKDGLPADFFVCQGFVTNTNGDISQQMDLIICRRKDSIIKSFGNTKIVRCDSVIAVIEIKSSITQKTFNTTLDAFKDLHRMGITNTYLFVYSKLTKNSIQKWLYSYKFKSQEEYIVTDEYLYDWLDKEWLPNAIVSIESNSLYALSIDAYDNEDWFGYLSLRIADRNKDRVSSLQEFLHMVLGNIIDKFDIAIEDYSINNGIPLFRI